MLSRLSKIQDDITFGFAEVIQHGQQKGWVKNDLDDWATAVFLEAITFGRLLDGISATKLNQDEWLKLVHSFVDKVLLESAEL